jgi:hypothetical protein
MGELDLQLGRRAQAHRHAVGADLKLKVRQGVGKGVVQGGSCFFQRKQEPVY